MALSTSVVNQGISSGTNFIFGVYLARTLVPVQFGNYGIGFSAILLYAGLCNAMFTTQMVVKLPGRVQQERAEYICSIHYLLVSFCLITLLAAILFAASLEETGIHGFSGAIASTTAAAAAYVIKDFFVRLGYSHYKEHVVLKINTSIALSTLAALAMCAYSDLELNAANALFIYGLGQLTGAAVGALHFRMAWRTVPSVSMLRNQLVDTWEQGRWSLAGSVVIWIQTQAYVLVSATFIGSAGVGIANAARLFIAPFIFLSPAINQLVLPRLSALRTGGVSSLLNRGRLYVRMMIALAMVYLLIIWLAFPSVNQLLLDGKYSQIEWVVAAWCGTLVMQMFREGGSTTLQALIEFKAIFVRNVASALVVSISAITFSYWFGVAGAVLALGFGELVLGILLWGKLKGLVTQYRN